MSYVIEDNIIEDTKLSITEKVVLSFIISRGECSDSLEVMKDQIGVDSVPTLRRTLKTLVSKGYLTVDNTSSNSPTTYSVVNDLNTCDTSVEGDYEPPRSGKINPKEVLRKGVKNRRNLLD